jgi:hypothetical protein
MSWSSEQKIVTGGHGSNTRPRILALDNQHGIILWGNEHTKSIHYSLWENDVLSPVYNINMKGSKAFITSWASTEIAGRDQYVYIVYKEDPAETGKIYLLRSDDYGKTFSPQIVAVDPIGFYSRFPGVAIDKDYQPIVSYMRFKTDWSEPEYVSIRSSDFGNTFDLFTEVTDKTKGEACDCCPVTMETDGDRIVVFYRNNRNNIRNMTAAVSLNNGLTYPIVKELDIADWQLFSCPSTGGDGFFNQDELHTTWTSARSGTSKVYYSKLNLNTLKIDAFEIMNHSIGRNFQQAYPRMAGNKDTVGIVWAELINAMDVLFTYFTGDNAGDLVKNTVRVNTDLTGNQAAPDLAYSHGNFYLCFQDAGDNTLRFKKGTFNTLTKQKEIKENSQLRISIVENGIRINSAKRIDRWKIFDMDGKELTSGLKVFDVNIHLQKKGLYFLHYELDGVEKINKIIY